MTQATFDFTGQRVLVTGGATGIGLATVRAFVDAGARVVAVDRDGDRLAEAVAGLATQEGEPVAVVVADLTEAEQIVRAAAQAEESFGGVDVLVNNAGVGAGCPFPELSDADLDLTLDVNLRATILLTREVIRGMLARGDGAVVNIASQAATDPSPQASHYAASKAGVVGFTTSLSAEVAPAVRVNAICPGMVMTGMMENNISLTMASKGITNEESLAQWSSGIPMERMQQPEDIAKSVLFLASDAASEITGIALYVTGGQTTH